MELLAKKIIGCNCKTVACTDNNLAKNIRTNPHTNQHSATLINS